jgi:hypothetical protein
MSSEKTRGLLGALTSAVVAIAAVKLRRAYDLGPVFSLSVLAVLTALLLWHLRKRSPYRERQDHLQLTSKREELLAQPRGQGLFTGLAIALLALTCLIDPVYSAPLGAGLLVAYVAIEYRQSKAARNTR